MLNFIQKSKLNEDSLAEYEAILASGDEAAIKEFEYFFGFTKGALDSYTPTNEEVELYKSTTDKIKLKTISQMLNFIPHTGQQPIFFTVDELKDVVNNMVMVLGRRTGKSAGTSIIATRELAVPFSSTILLTPTFNNAKIIFNEVLKHVQKLKMPIKSINRGSFRFELENGARFSANSASNIESALGSSNSLLLVDESQSIPNLEEIMNQMLVPTLLDYGTRESGILYGRQIYLGTPRGTENHLFDLFEKQNTFPNWKSFSAPSHTNPILPTEYFEQMRLELGDMLYRQEILAEFYGSDDNVFFAFDKEINTYREGSIQFSAATPVVSGIDIGYKDSTAQLWAYRFPNGDYYIDEAYSENMRTTANHIAAYKGIEDSMLSLPEMRYCDPSAAQLIADYADAPYNYFCVPAKNDVDPSIKYINQLLTPTGANQKPKLYINDRLEELIRQVSRVRYKEQTTKTSKDPFIKDPKGTHWDLVAALRYMLYSDQYNQYSGMIIVS